VIKGLWINTLEFVRFITKIVFRHARKRGQNVRPPCYNSGYKEKQAVKKSAKERSNQMLTQNTLDKIVYEYQHGGVKSNHPELTTYERKALLKHLFSLKNKAPEVETPRAGHN
jgi:hypothetical protein